MYEVNDKIITTDDKVGYIRSIKDDVGSKIVEIELVKDGSIIYRDITQILRKFK